MQSKVIKTRENIKPAYSTAKSNGELFVHGVTLDDGVEYESHQKKNTNKLIVGQIIDYTVDQDSRGNKKIKLAQVQPPPTYAASTAPQQYSTPLNVLPAPQNVLHPHNLPQEVIDKVEQTAIWLSVFRSLCILKAGSMATSEDVVRATDILVAKSVPR